MCFWFLLVFMDVLDKVKCNIHLCNLILHTGKLLELVELRILLKMMCVFVELLELFSQLELQVWSSVGVCNCSHSSPSPWACPRFTNLQIWVLVCEGPFLRITLIGSVFGIYKSGHFNYLNISIVLHNRPLSFNLALVAYTWSQFTHGIPRLS